MKFQPPKGTRDLLPEDAERFEKIRKIVTEIFRKYGFSPIYTPCFEKFDLLAAKGGLGEAIKDEIYYFKDKSDREMGLRPDLTVPLARIISSNPSIQKPFKRYSIGKVWRYDNPQAMRWREFWQADIDTIGTDSILADAEVVAASCECLEKLGFKDYYIRVNNRKFLDNEIGKCVPKEKIAQVFRIIDKLDKIGKEGVVKELKKIDCDREEIRDIISGKKSANSDAEIKQLLEYLKDFGVSEKVKVDTSLVRGLDYYTGLVFEVFLGSSVSCGGGGRYDNLIEKIGGQKTAAVGISLGLDRIMEIMKERKMNIVSGKEKVFVANVDESVRKDVIEVAQKLRKEGITCQINLSKRYLSKQLEFANSQGIRYVLIVGKEELKAKKFKLRDMNLKKQEDLDLKSIAAKLK